MCHWSHTEMYQGVIVDEGYTKEILVKGYITMSVDDFARRSWHGTIQTMDKLVNPFGRYYLKLHDGRMGEIAITRIDLSNEGNNADFIGIKPLS